MRLTGLLLALVSVCAAYYSPEPSATTVSCMSDKGTAVDYWVAIKKNGGYNYIYADADNSTFGVSPYDMEADKSSGTPLLFFHSHGTFGVLNKVLLFGLLVGRRFGSDVQAALDWARVHRVQ
jgi:hypothetical protein